MHQEVLKKIDFCLLTTIKVENLEDALKIIRIYRLRWVIEEYHRVLENTCKVERLRNDTAERISRIIGFYMIIAWRIMLLLQLGRNDPSLPPDIVLSQTTLQALTIIGSRCYGEKPNTIGESNEIIGKLGGFTGPQKGSRLGYEVFGRGLETFHKMLTFYQWLLDILPPNLATTLMWFVGHGSLAGIDKEVLEYFRPYMSS